MNKRLIRVAFANMTLNWNVQDNFIIEALSDNYKVTVVDSSTNPDVLFYSCFLENRQNVFAGNTRIYISGENDFPNLTMCDYSITHYQLNSRNFRLPYFFYHTDSCAGINPYKELSEGRRMPAKKHSGFCCSVISNSTFADPRRIELVRTLESVGNVSHGGALFNNTGGPVKDKLEFISNHDFCIAAENSVSPGYVTEKITDAFYARTVPIYFGAPEAVEDFNSDSFIRASDFGYDFNALAEYVRTMTPEQYAKMLESDPIKIRHSDYKNSLSRFLEEAIETGRQRPLYGRASIIQGNEQWIYKNIFCKL